LTWFFEGSLLWTGWDGFSTPRVLARSPSACGPGPGAISSSSELLDPPGGAMALEAFVVLLRRLERQSPRLGRADAGGGGCLLRGGSCSAGLFGFGSPGLRRSCAFCFHGLVVWDLEVIGGARLRGAQAGGDSSSGGEGADSPNLDFVFDERDSRLANPSGRMLLDGGGGSRPARFVGQVQKRVEVLWRPRDDHWQRRRVCRSGCGRHHDVVFDFL